MITTAIGYALTFVFVLLALVFFIAAFAKSNQFTTNDRTMGVLAGIVLLGFALMVSHAAGI